MKYTPVQIDKMLASMVVCVDTREQDTKALRQRMEGFGCPSVRQKLDYGDYAAHYTDPDGQVQTLAVAVERKMSLDELCSCFTTGRARFKREFERAKANGARIHLVVENDNYEHLRHGKYRSKLAPKSLIASFLSWSVRYNMQLHFCMSETTGWLVGEILHYELREYLINQQGGDGDASAGD